MDVLATKLVDLKKGNDVQRYYNFILTLFILTFFPRVLLKRKFLTILAVKQWLQDKMGICLKKKKTFLVQTKVRKIK